MNAATEHHSPTAAPAVAAPKLLALPFTLGQLYPEHGGHYAGAVSGRGVKPDWHLFVPADPGDAFKALAFGNYGKRVDGADDHVDGLANTAALIDSGMEHPAAKACRELTVGAFADFYLPSHNELMLCWVNVPHLFEKDDWYWSSTQRQGNSSYAWGQGFALAFPASTARTTKVAFAPSADWSFSNSIISYREPT